MLQAILEASYGGTWRASEAINDAIGAAPEEWLERKPGLVHVQLSDSTVKKLSKVAKKHKLSKATLIERALDWQYRKTALTLAKAVAATADAAIDRKERPFPIDVESAVSSLLFALLPFGPFDLTISGGHKPKKPYMVIGESWRTPYEPVDVAEP